jgi:hypothetical protein
MGALRNAYYWLFYAFYQVNPVRVDRFDLRVKTLGVFSLVQCCVVASVLFSLGLILRSAFAGEIPKPVVALGAAAILGLNYAATLRRDRWEQYGKRFGKLPARVRKRRIVIAWLGTAVVFALTLGLSYAYGNSPMGAEARARAIEAKQKARMTGRRE